MAPSLEAPSMQPLREGEPISRTGCRSRSHHRSPTHPQSRRNGRRSSPGPRPQAVLLICPESSTKSECSWFRSWTGSLVPPPAHGHGTQRPDGRPRDRQGGAWRAGRHHTPHSGVEKMPSDPPPNPPLVRGGAWRSLTLVDGRCPPRHKFSTEKLGFHVLRIWFRKKWGFESPFPHYGCTTAPRFPSTVPGYFG